MTEKLHEQQTVSTDTPPIWEAAINEDWDTVKEWLQRDPSLINITGKHEGYEMSLLHFAIGQEQDLQLVEYLVSLGADVNAQFNVRKPDIDDKGELRGYGIYPTPPPLHFAAIQDNTNVDVVLFLILQGANVNATDHDGRTPLHYCAMRKSDINALTYFVDRGGNAEKEADWTPLDQAADNSSSELMKALIIAGADVHVRDHEGKKPMGYADTVEKRRILREAVRRRCVDDLWNRQTDPTLPSPMPRPMSSPPEVHVHVHIHTDTPLPHRAGW